jgi:lipopolysaccharide cholinephosphotransferase
VRTLFSPASLHRRIQRILREYSNDEAMFLADHDYKPCKGVMPKAVYGKPQRVKFEYTELNGVAQPDVYLRRLYGNYMELPKQLPPQNYRFLDLNKPWRQYIKEQDS